MAPIASLHGIDKSCKTLFDAESAALFGCVEGSPHANFPPLPVPNVINSRVRAVGGVSDSAGTNFNLF